MLLFIIFSLLLLLLLQLLYNYCYYSYCYYCHCNCFLIIVLGVLVQSIERKGYKWKMNKFLNVKANYNKLIQPFFLYEFFLYCIMEKSICFIIFVLTLMIAYIIIDLVIIRLLSAIYWCCGLLDFFVKLLITIYTYSHNLYSPQYIEQNFKTRMNK